MMEGIDSRRRFRTRQMDAAATFLVYLLLSAPGSLNIFQAEAQQQTKPLECVPALGGNACSSYLYVAGDPSRSVDQIAALYKSKVFDPPWPSVAEVYLVQVDCFCKNYNSTLSAYFAPTSYTAQESDASLDDINHRLFDDMALFADDAPPPVAGKPIEVDLLCGCPVSGADDSLQQSIVTYIVQKGEILANIVKALQSSQALTALINNIPDFNTYVIYPGMNLFIPISSKPTAFAGAPRPPESGSGAKRSHGGGNAGLIAGCMVAGLVLLLVLLCSVLLHRRRRQQRACPERAAYNNAVLFGSISCKSSEHAKSTRFPRLCSVFGRCAAVRTHRGCSVNDNVKRNITLPREAMNVFDQEKPIIFQYQEIIAATQHFDPSKKLGQGAFGTVFRGTLRHQEVAVKQMKATKTKEFLAELTVLCKVHHTNLIELLGYSAGEEDLFLVYEFAQNGSLSDHLHDPVSKGNVPLTWTARVQIAIDAARGLEYIHEHTKTQYVHRDVKTRNILLDTYFRAKLADFGLAKLIEQKDGSPDVIKTATLSGTFGYLAPEYVRDGLATPKSDVYAFGVVVFELITGREALSSVKPDPSDDSKSQHRQSLISAMLRVLDPEPEDLTTSKKFRSSVDPNLDGNYPFDAAYKMAQLGKACIDEDPRSRPDMKQIVFALSQNLLMSIEWEAALAGNSQIFSGLVQGR